MASVVGSRRKSAVGLMLEILLLLVFVVLFVFPFLNQLAVSLSSGRAVLSGEVGLFPVEFTARAWQNAFKNKDMMNALWFTVLITVIQSVLHLITITLAAYPLTSKKLRFKGVIFTIFMIPMYFSGGLIPTYLFYKDIGLLNNPMVLVLPGLFSMYNMLILMTNISSIPDSLEESAKLDGACDFVVLLRIIIPLSVPVYATLALFCAVGRWNGFSDALFFMPTNKSVQPLQLVLRRTLDAIGDQELILEKLDGTERTISETQKAANLMFTVIPIICVYPWLQRYFIKGVMVGAIKS